MGNSISSDAGAILGIVALIVSLVALLTTTLQVLQQYFASAEGYRNCAESVMGLWARGTLRRLRMTEFRVEVVFETPVIFLAHPSNQKGPLAGRSIYYIDGTDRSYHETRVLLPEDQRKADEQAIVRLNTADNERATWVTLLSILQYQERESRQWDEDSRLNARSRKALVGKPEHTVAIGLQSRTRSWDFMPPNIKPFSATAICHLVEMVAMLGMYWKVFDEDERLKAEGNGIALKSINVRDIGLMVSFFVTGKNKFQENRVIPCIEMKDLAFGFVPNIFEDSSYLRDENNAQAVKLVFGAMDDVANTLQSLGCSFDTLDRFQSGHTHLFSVAFEIIGMLGTVFRIRGSSFNMLPNPTRDHWFKGDDSRHPAWKIERLMDVFQGKVRELCSSEDYDPGNLVSRIPERWEAIEVLRSEAPANVILDIETREAIHDVLDETTEYLLSLRQIDVLSVLVGHIDKVIDCLRDPSCPLNRLNSIGVVNKEQLFIDYYFDIIRLAAIDHPDENGNPPTGIYIQQRNTVWMYLMFRMLCWFMLHDFDKADVKIVPSHLRGSRMPIYIN